MKSRLISFLATFGLLIAVFVSSVSAHVVTSPSKVETAARQDFTVGVPNEKDIPTTQVRLVIPEGLESVTPYVKAGWTITTTKTGEGEEALVTEITWKGGSIGEGLRDNFVFRAVTPADPTTLVWKAYQTYSDGTVVAWDQEGDEESETTGPASKTEVVVDLTPAPAEVAQSLFEENASMVAYAALLLAAVSLALILRRR